MQTALMLGAGHSPVRRRLQAPTSATESETVWTTLDANPDSRPDVQFNLNDIERGHRLPVADETFDEIHCYEVLEHYGRPGDYIGFFAGFREFWRILKPGGLLLGTSPAWDSRWAWGDPGHARTIQPEHFFFLERKNYSDHLGKTPMSDYRSYVEPYWWTMLHNETKDGQFSFALEKSK